MIQLRRIHQRGFTLIELMIATTVFSVILLAAATTLIQVGRMYYKGVISSKTQGVARTVTDNITQSLQFSSGGQPKYFGPVSNQPIPTQVRCFGTTRYTYVLNMQLNDAVAYDVQNKQVRHVLWQDKVGSPENCKAPGQFGTPDLTKVDPGEGSDGVEGRELMEAKMRLTSLCVQSVTAAQSSACPAPDSTDRAFLVNVGVIYGDNDLLLPNADNPTSCKGAVVGGQWCAVSNLTTQVYKRVE